MTNKENCKFIALIGASNPGGFRSGVGPWKLAVHIVAFEKDHSNIREQNVRLEMQVSEEELANYQSMLSPYQIIEFDRLQEIGSGTYEIENLLVYQNYHKELEELSKKLQEPVKIEIEGLGELQLNRRFNEYEGSVRSKLFDEDVMLSIEEGVDFKYAVLCVEHLNSLPPGILDKLFEACIRYCNDFLDSVGEELIRFEQPGDIIKLISPGTIMIAEPVDENVPVVHMSLGCEWEEEHGLEWVIRDDEVLYVGAFQGNDPWSDYSSKKTWNYS